MQNSHRSWRDTCKATSKSGPIANTPFSPPTPLALCVQLKLPGCWGATPAYCRGLKSWQSTVLLNIVSSYCCPAVDSPFPTTLFCFLYILIPFWLLCLWTLFPAIAARLWMKSNIPVSNNIDIYFVYFDGWILFMEYRFLIVLFLDSKCWRCLSVTALNLVDQRLEMSDLVHLDVANNKQQRSPTWSIGIMSL